MTLLHAHMFSELEPVNVVIADDHPLFRRGLHDAIRRHKYIAQVFEASNGLEALNIMHENEIHVLFLDYQMPIMDGAQCLKKVKELYPNTKVIVLSMFDDDKIVLSMIHEGANGYVLKNKIGDVITVAIKAVLRGSRYFDDDVQAALKRLEKKIIPETKDKKIPQLTDREFDVLKQIALGKSIDDICALLNIKYDTVKQHKSSGMNKTETKSPVQVTKYFLGNGFMTLEEFLNS